MYDDKFAFENGVAITDEINRNMNNHYQLE